MNNLTDQALVVQTLAGQTQSYGELVNRCQQSVFNVCYRILGERRDAEDLAQDAFLRAYQKLDSFDVEREFGPWVRKIAANLCLNELQKRTKQQEFSLDKIVLAAPPSDIPEKKYLAKAAAHHIRQAILSLPPPYRVVIELRHYQDLSYNEIAQTLDLPLSDVKSHLFRARKLLAKSLSEENE